MMLIIHTKLINTTSPPNLLSQGEEEHDCKNIS